jgi:photosystem II stability/assembly factor-like uncharacterized protein
MKKILLVIICNLILLSTGFAQWQKVNNESADGYILYALTVDPTTNNIYAGTEHGVFVSTDNGSTWVGKNEDFLVNDFNVSSIAISGSNIFIGTWWEFGAFLSTNNGSSWTPVNNGLSGKDLNVNTIAINEDNIYIGIVHVGLKAYSSIWKRLQSELIISVN